MIDGGDDDWNHKMALNNY